ncbi:MAG TPA: LysR substrate-binding domain-containing protein [Stellaceae bacterium]|nr:LysR substrate-binding domain-containing protein [Stellaceae bacterium]
MKIEQLRILCEVVDQGYSMSRAAGALGTSQPNVSKQIRLLEEQLSVDLLLRRGGRVIGMTEPGDAVLKVARRIVRDASNLKNISEDYRRGDRGRLTIATTHLIARYMLTDCIERFHRQYPQVQITLHETTQRHALEMLQTTEADLGILSDPPRGSGSGIVQLVSQLKIGMSLVAKRDHPLLQQRQGQALTLEKMEPYPFVLLDPRLSGGWSVKHAYEQAGLNPNVVMTAGNIEVVKAYVARGLGVALLPSLCVDEHHDPELGTLDARHLLDPLAYFIGLHPESFLRNYVYDFIAYVAPEWTRRRVSRRLRQVLGTVR